MMISEQGARQPSSGAALYANGKTPLVFDAAVFTRAFEDGPPVTAEVQIARVDYERKTAVIVFGEHDREAIQALSLGRHFHTTVSLGELRDSRRAEEVNPDFQISHEMVLTLHALSGGELGFDFHSQVEGAVSGALAGRRLMLRAEDAIAGHIYYSQRQIYSYDCTFNPENLPASHFAQLAWQCSPDGIDQAFAPDRRRGPQRHRRQPHTRPRRFLVSDSQHRGCAKTASTSPRGRAHGETLDPAGRKRATTHAGGRANDPAICLQFRPELERIGRAGIQRAKQGARQTIPAQRQRGVARYSNQPHSEFRRHLSACHHKRSTATAQVSPHRPAPANAAGLKSAALCRQGNIPQLPHATPRGIELHLAG